jgi:hypothetical protein
MRIDNAFSFMMERRAGSSTAATPLRYDAEDCHEYVSSTICKCSYSPSFVSKIQGIHKGYSTTTMQIFPLIYAHFLVFGYTEYKGKQKEIFDAAINGVSIRNLST